LVVCAGPLVYYALAAIPVREVPLHDITANSAGWSRSNLGGDRPFAWRPAFTGASEHVAALWQDGSHRVVVDQLTYREQSQGAELIGFSSRIAPDEDLMARPAMGMLSDGRIVNIAVVHDESAPVLVWYWYDVGGVETASGLRAKLLEVWAFVRRASVSRLHAVSTTCDADNCREAARALAGFLGVAAS
jgi:EpsI family protein